MIYEKRKRQKVVGYKILTLKVGHNDILRFKGKPPMGFLTQRNL